jgi:hypothetical protein
MVATAKGESDTLKVLVVADAATVIDLREAVIAGVDSFVLTSAPVEELRDAVARTARGERIVLMDADGQDDPREIPRLLAALDQTIERDQEVVAGRTAKLGADYIVEGSIRRRGGKIRVTAHLIETGTGQLLWTDRYDEHLEALFEVQDAITNMIVASIETEIGTAERSRLVRRAPVSLRAWDLFQLGTRHLYKSTRQDNLDAQRLLRLAIDNDDRLASAHAYLSYAILLSMLYFDAEPEESRLDEVLTERGLLRADHGQPPQCAHGAQGVGAVATDEVVMDGAEGCVIHQEVGQGRAGYEEFGGDRVAVLVVAQGQLGQPGRVLDRGAGGGDQVQDRLGDGFGVLGVQGLPDGGLGVGVGQDRGGTGLHRAQAQQQRVGGVGVHQAHAQSGQDGRVEPVALGVGDLRPVLGGQQQ